MSLSARVSRSADCRDGRVEAILDVGRQRDVTLLGQVGLTLVGRARQERLHCCGGVRVVALGADDRVRGENQRVAPASLVLKIDARSSVRSPVASDLNFAPAIDFAAVSLVSATASEPVLISATESLF